MLAAARDGNPDARGTFVATYLSVVRAFLFRRWRSGPWVRCLDDAVQEVFLDFLRDDGALARLDTSGDRNFRTFLFGVTLKVAKRWEERSRNDRRRNDPDLPSEEFPSGADSLSKAFDREWAIHLMARARERMARCERERGNEDRRYVELLQLRFGEGLPIREIAVRWKADPAQLHHDYARAREAFKKALFEEVSFHHRGTDAEIENECRNLLQCLRS